MSAEQLLSEVARILNRKYGACKIGASSIQIERFRLGNGDLALAFPQTRNEIAIAGHNATAIIFSVSREIKLKKEEASLSESGGYIIFSLGDEKKIFVVIEHADEPEGPKLLLRTLNYCQSH